MITLRKSTIDELTRFCNMEQQAHAHRFLNRTTLEAHTTEFLKPNVVYLSIVNGGDRVVGYFILVFTAEIKEVEFRRIVIDDGQQGIGQIAIKQMLSYCKNTRNYQKIWLDVYDDNLKGIHIYEKLGFEKFKAIDVDGRQLLFYKKTL